MAAVANTSSAGPLFDVLSKNEKFADLLTNRRHRIIRTPTSEPDDPKPKEKCAQNYSPCSCDVNYKNEISVYCHGVSVESVRDAFLRINDPEIYSLVIYRIVADAKNTISLPADFLGNTRVTAEIVIDGTTYWDKTNSTYIPDYSKIPNLVIHPLTFQSSQNSLMSFKVSNFDFGLQKDFNFLKGFNRLEELDIYRTNNLTAFQYLPQLPSLQTFKVGGCNENCSDIVPVPDLCPTNLKTCDQQADEIVAKLATSTSADSLEVLNLIFNSVTRIPSQVGSAFPKLTDVDLRGSSISHIPSSSLTFTYPLMSINFHSNSIKTIESGAFQGKSTSTRARKNNNSIFYLFL